jgi:ABC-type multidrug transport system fused ATPase/permease subunit
MVLNILDQYEDSIKELELGEINAKLLKFPGVVTSLFERLKNHMIPHLLLHLGVVILFFWVDKYLGITLLVTVVIIYVIMLRGPSKCNDVTKKRDVAYNKLYEEIDDNLRNLYSIYGANQKNSEIDRIDKYNSWYNKLYYKTTLCSFNVRSLISPIVIVFILVIMFRIKYLVTSNKVQLSMFIPIFFISMYVINSFMSTDDQVKNIIFEWGMLKGCVDILTSGKSTRQNRKKILPNPQNESGLRLVNVSFKFPNQDHMILNKLNLQINNGESVAILGDIGSGKSTVLKLLLGYYRPVKGSIFFNDVNYKDLAVKTIRQKIGYVPQVPVLFNRSIIDNILYGNKETPRQEVEEVLKELGLLSEFKKHKHGLDTKVGKNGSNVSGGQRQLIWCLRVLFKNPEVLILDEPTSSIDEKSKLMLKQLLERYMKGKTIIMVTHDPQILSFAHKFVIIKNGKVDKVKYRG